MTTIKKLESILSKVNDIQEHMKAYADDQKTTHVTKANKKIVALTDFVQTLVDKKKKTVTKKPKLNNYIIFANSIRADVMKKLGKSANMADVAREIGRLWREKKETMSETSSVESVEVKKAAPKKRAPKAPKKA